MHLPDSKLLNALERLSETLKSLLWEQAKRYGVSPIQIQILLFVAEQPADLTGVSYLAREFNVTKAEDIRLDCPEFSEEEQAG